MRGALALLAMAAIASGCEQQAEAPEEAVATDIPEELQQDALPVQPAAEAGIGTPMAERVPPASPARLWP